MREDEIADNEDNELPRVITGMCRLTKFGGILQAYHTTMLRTQLSGNHDDYIQRSWNEAKRSETERQNEYEVLIIGHVCRTRCCWSESHRTLERRRWSASVWCSAAVSAAAGCGDTDFDECWVLDAGRFLPGRGSLPPRSGAGRSRQVPERRHLRTIYRIHLAPSPPQSERPLIASQVSGRPIRAAVRCPGHQGCSLPPQPSPVALSASTQMDR